MATKSKSKNKKKTNGKKKEAAKVAPLKQSVMRKNMIRGCKDKIEIVRTHIYNLKQRTPSDVVTAEVKKYQEILARFMADEKLMKQHKANLAKARVTPGKISTQSWDTLLNRAVAA